MPPLPPRPAQPPSGGGAADRLPAGGTPPGALAGAITFESLAEIATGATARVDLCRLLPPHRRAGGLIAVKRLHPHVAEDPTFTKEFLDEVWMTASLRHPNVVEVAGWGSDVQGQYLAVELVQGVSLLRLMKTIFETGEAFTERMVVYIASRICLGLAAAHSLRAQSGELLNLVHRDLTPGNVLCGFNGEVKIADFGMAKAKQRLTRTLTGMRKGEPTYMAPEQASSDDIDARADLFSLGVLLFELFAGRRPWVAKSDFEMVQVSSREPPADLRELRPKIDKELVLVVNRCLEKAPAARWQTAHEIAARLDEWLAVHGYQEDNEEALGRFVRRNAMRQMRWFERAIAGELSAERVGRELPPRVPTYTEHTKPPVQPAQGPARPTAPRPGSAPARPVDPRSLRAANAVQQLKKLAPPVEPPRARARRVPSMNDDDGDPTDVQLRIGSGVLKARPAPFDDDDDEGFGEEVPTLVQKDDARLRQIRAEAAQMRAESEGRGKPPYASPGMIVDEESDQRVTDVKREDPRGGRGKGFPMADPESDLPTSPLPLSPPQKLPTPPPADPADMPTPIKGQPARSTPLRGMIPPSPEIPQRPFQMASPGHPAERPRAFPEGHPAERPRAFPDAHPPGPADADKPSRTTARPPAPRSGEGSDPASVGAARPPADPARVSYDDVQVIDRGALQHSLTSEEAVVAEADRLSIEAVRRTEEARAAQLRAEKKAAAAKIAGEAAVIAAEALRLLRASGLPAALKRIEEARALDADLQAGRIPGGDSSVSLRPPGPTYPEAVATQASAALAPAPAGEPSRPRPGPGASTSSSPPAFLKQIPPIGAPPPHLYIPPAAPPPHIPPAPVPPVPQAPIPPPAPPPALTAPLAPDALPANFHPTIFGLPSMVVISLSGIALAVAVILFLLLSK